MKDHHNSEYPLRLELLCGSTEDDLDQSHPGRWRGISAEGVHPGQARVKEELKDVENVDVEISAHEENGIEYSDAYVYFGPEAIIEIARVCRDYHPGDILDIIGDLSDEDIDKVLKVAKREHWEVEE